MSQPSTDESRKFELWAAQHGLWLDRAVPGKNRTYHWDHTEAAWQGWLASRAVHEDEPEKQP